MPTPRMVQAIVRQRTSLVVDRVEANRLIGIVLADPTRVDPIEVFGRHHRSGEPTSAQLRVTEVLLPPEGFVKPA